MYPLRDDAKTLVSRLGLTNPFGYYSQIVEWLAGLKGCVIRPMRDFEVPLPPGRVSIGLRHDMDTEPYSSVEVARELHAAGLTGSFYVLHTADYYGRWIEDVYRRTAEIAPMLRQIQDDFQCEVGLHNDGLWVYEKWGADGSQAVRDELAWLRSEGLKIVGTAAHNSAPIYGAENFELFRGRAAVNRSQITVDGRTIPLQTLDESALGLAYEANFPKPARRPRPDLERYLAGLPEDAVRDREWMRTYLVDNPHCSWGPHYNLWLIGRDRWVIAGRRRLRNLFIWDATLQDVKKFVERVQRGRRIVLHIHPVYIDLPEATSAV